MNQVMSPEDARRSKLLERLARDPVSHRHVYGALDPQYHHFTTDRQEHELILLDDLPLLVWTRERVACLWDEPGEATVDAIAGFISERQLNELTVLGEEGFRVLRPRLTGGKWRLSRNYGVTVREFVPRPLTSIRRLSEADEAAVERACEKVKVLGESHSTRRDFGLMGKGLPVPCYGAFADGELVGFCSANPICRGVQEISWIAVAAQHRRRGLAAALLTAQAGEAFAEGKAVGYHAGSAGDDLQAMVRALGFREVKPTYRLIPSDSEEQWRTGWGKGV